MNELSFLVVLLLFGWCIGLNARIVNTVRRAARRPRVPQPGLTAS